MLISVVIPTCDRKSRLLSLLDSLHLSSVPLLEIIIVDSGSDRLEPADYAPYENLNILYVDSEKSVCIQRNKGIRMARAPWVFLCDDDVRVPSDYLEKLIGHITALPATGAISGLFLQLENEVWTAQYPLRSAKQLIWTFIFQGSVWGEIELAGNHGWVVKKIKEYYLRKGNHISGAGWPVITQFSGEYFETPLYSLGAALVRKDWLLAAPFDEVLDPHGLGDNYGVAASIPGDSLTVLNSAFVFHHKEPVNRLKRPVQYFRRVLALDYFISTKEKLHYAKKYRLLWSLVGNILNAVRTKDRMMLRPGMKAIWMIATRQNPYKRGARDGKKVLEPMI